MSRQFAARSAFTLFGSRARRRASTSCSSARGRASTVLLAIGLLGVAACNKSEPSAASPAPAQPAEQKVVAAGPVIEDTTFKLALASDGELTANAPANLKLVLEARGGYHVNQDYPIKVQLKTASGVKLTKPTLGKADAAEFGEHKVRFELPVTAEAGTRELSADVDFAVCTAETCVPDQRTVVLSLNVK
jgi:hypothetical protein